MSNLPLGWVPPADRDKEARDAHDAAIKAMPKFVVPRLAVTPPVGTLVLLTDLWKHSLVKSALGYEFTGHHQLTGSCVGVGGGNVAFTVSCIDAVVLGDAQKVIMPFWGYTYGKSRERAGMRGQGEGSMGSTYAEAAVKDGYVDVNYSGIPKPQSTDDGWVWGSAVERKWSAGENAPTDVVSEARNHLVTETTELHSGNEVRDAIMGYGPVSRAFGKFCNPGTQKIQGDAQKATILSYNGSGGHQEAWLGYYHHPDLGELIWEQNQWGLDVYGDDPAGGPKGGGWLPLAKVDQECKSGDAEIFAFRGIAGWDGNVRPWLA